MSYEVRSILMLPEDFVTCLAEDRETNIWMGFRTEGCAVLNPEAGKTDSMLAQANRWVARQFCHRPVADGAVRRLRRHVWAGSDDAVAG